MPRLLPSFLRHAQFQDHHLPLLLRTCRDLPSARNELRWLKEHVDFTNPPSEPKDHARKRLKRLCISRGRGKPLQYILGNQPFGDLGITCRPGVLIPRYYPPPKPIQRPQSSNIRFPLQHRNRSLHHPPRPNTTPTLPPSLPYSLPYPRPLHRHRLHCSSPSPPSLATGFLPLSPRYRPIPPRHCPCKSQPPLQHSRRPSRPTCHLRSAIFAGRYLSEKCRTRREVGRPRRESTLHLSKRL